MVKVRSDVRAVRLECREAARQSFVFTFQDGPGVPVIKKNRVAYGYVGQGSLNGTHFGGIKQYKFIVILRDFTLLVPCFGLVTQKWRLDSDDFPFQLADFYVPC